MNAKPFATLLALTATFAVPTVASATTPQQAASASWELRSSNLYPQTVAVPIHDRLHLSDPGLSPSYWWYGGDHRGLTRIDSQVTSRLAGGEWIIANGLFMHIEVFERHTFPYVGFAAAQFGLYDAATRSITEGVDLRTQAVEGGLFNMAQAPSVAAPGAGVDVNMAGCWSMTTDWCDFDSNTLSCSYTWPVTHEWNLYADGTAASTATGEVGTYAAIQNSAGDELFVLMFGNGRTSGGLISQDGNGQRQVHPDDAMSFAPRLSLNGQLATPALTPAYDTGSGDDPRLGTFSLTFVHAGIC